LTFVFVITGISFTSFFPVYRVIIKFIIMDDFNFKFKYIVLLIETVIKFLESRWTIFSAHTNVIKITIPKNGGHFERRAAIGRRNTPRHSKLLYHAHS